MWAQCLTVFLLLSLTTHAISGQNARTDCLNDVDWVRKMNDASLARMTQTGKCSDAYTIAFGKDRDFSAMNNIICTHPVCVAARDSLQKELDKAEASECKPRSLEGTKMSLEALACKFSAGSALEHSLVITLSCWALAMTVM